MRNIINKQLEQYKNKKVALLFSGGLDSLSLMISCLDVGIKPTLYSFKLEGIESDDIKASRRIANIYGLKLVEVTIPKNISTLIDDVELIIEKFKVKKKTQIQCIQPFIHIVKYVEEDIVLSGLCADDILGTSRKMQVNGRNNNEVFYQMRLDKQNDILSSSYCFIKRVFEEKEKQFIAPYKENMELVNYILSKDFSQLHKPKLKQLTYDNYKNEIDKYNLYRKNSSLQVNSGVREWHDELLKTELNVNNWKSVVGIYNYIYKQKDIELKQAR